MLFEINNLKKLYDQRSVLDIPSLVFRKGRIYSLLGPNGSGKTTLLEILGLLIPPTSGEIKYKGMAVDFKGNNLTALRRRIVMVQQNPILFTATVHKNLEFGLKVRGIPKTEREGIIESSLDLVGMRDFIHADAKTLSGGETQRVAIAQALACSPEVMLFDEPTANVDIENQTTIEKIIKEINEEKHISIIFSTHNLSQASKLTNNVISLFEGKQAPSALENIFGGRIEEDDKGNRLCLIQDTFKLLVETERSGKVRVAIDPTKVEIFLGQGATVERNAFKGRITQLMDADENVKAVIDIGVPVTILIPKELMKAESIRIGGEIVVFCPQESIQIF